MSVRSSFIYFLVVIFAVTLVSCTNLPAQIEDESGVPMALVPAGEYKLTNKEEVSGEISVRTVNVGDFYIDLYEVTNRQYVQCVDDRVCVEPENKTVYSNPEFIDHPVVFVTWDMAQTFCEWRGARLPKKAEWEKAASDELANVDYYWGDESPLCQVGARLGAAVDENAGFDTGTEPAGSYGPNRYGLYDMTGNVWEWVQDEYVEGDYKSSPSFVSFLRMARWSGYGPIYQRFLCGFRCARSP